MKVFKFLFLPFLFVSPASASLSLTDVLDQMSAKNQMIRNIQFEFHQKIDFLNTPEPSHISGVAIFQKPGLMRIHKQKPDNQLTISNGKKLWVYTPAYNQVWQGTTKNWVGASFLPKGIVPLDNFVPELKKNFHLKLIPQSDADDSELWLLAEPLDTQLGYQMEFLISKETWLPVKTVFKSESAKIVTELLNTQINLDISTATFRFQAPKGTEVIPL